MKVDSDQLCSSLSICFTDVDDEYEDEEDPYDEGADGILEKGEAELNLSRCFPVVVLTFCSQFYRFYSARTNLLPYNE